MAPRPGGESDKLGNKYEGAWAIRHALYCILDSTCSLTPEDIHQDLGQGSEFTYFSGRHTEVHQLKRQNGNKNSWSISALDDFRVFRDAARHVEAGRQYHFSSLIPCGPLRELTERARKAVDLPAFTGSWLTDELRTAFDQLSAAVLPSAQVAWTTLRGMWFAVHDEGDVIRTNSRLAELLLEGAKGHLISLAIGDVLLDNLGKSLTRTELLEHLEEPGITLLAAKARAPARERVRDLTDSWIGTVQRELLRPPIARAEAAQLVETLESNRLALILGSAGGGKSSVLEQAVALLRGSGAELLALRLDRVEPFVSTLALGQQLGLDTSPAVALALAANGRDAYLVLDQMDAVSLASGRIPGSFDVVMDLIGEALSVPGVRVILVCREFDVENDHRMRELARRSDLRQVHVGPLSTQSVEEAVERMGLDPAQLTSTQINLLRTPLHLVLLNGIAGKDEELSFQSRSSLFADFWERKRQAAKSRRPGVRFNDSLARVANAVSDRQTLSVPVEVLDEEDLSDDANVLVSEHVLARDGDRIAFFHETFFDYTFARQWVSRGESLVEFLLRDEQELFRRAQVRQILQHLHERELEGFIQELETLLTSVSIRFHIKETGLAVFANLPAPTTAEVDLALRVAATNPSWEGRLWQHLRRREWFKQFHEDGFIAAWLDGTDDELKKHAVNFMESGAKEHGDDVAGLLRARRTAPEYFDWLRRVLWSAELHTNRRLFDLLLAAVRDGAYDEAERDLWYTVHKLGTHQPGWAVELLQARLVDHVNALALDPSGKVETLTVREYGASELVRQSAAAEPQAFVETIVPYLLSVMASTEYRTQDDGPLHDEHFTYRISDVSSDDHEFGDALLNATIRALEALVRCGSGALRPTLELLVEAPHEAAQSLLYRALAAGEGALAEWAADLLLQNASRLPCGCLSDGHWVAREMVKANAPHVDDAVHRQLEDRFLDLRCTHEQRLNIGRTAFAYLSALEERRLSQDGMRRLQEYRRKYRQEAPSPPQGTVAGMIGSPIEAEAVTKMTDAQWLKAMSKHDKDVADWNTFKGGARELSQQLREQVTSEPGRFAGLALQMTADLHPAYGDAILMGFGEAVTDADADSVFAAIRHIASLGHASNDRWLGMALRRHLPEIPLDLVELVLSRAMQSTDPADDVLIGDSRRADRLRAHGINTVRGSLAEALGDMLVHDANGERTKLVRGHLNDLANDPVLSVRSCAAHTLAGSLRHARAAAIEAFEHLIGADDVLIATDNVQRLMVYIGNVNPEVIDPVIRRALSSGDDEAREAGGQLAAYAAAEWDRPKLIEQALNGDTQMRQGAAQMCAKRIGITSNTELASSALLTLLDDEDEGVRKAVAQFAPKLRGHRLRPYATLLEALINSPTYEHAIPQLLITLQYAPDTIDDLALKAAQRFLNVFGKEAADTSTGAAADARYISELVVRGLAQSQDPGHRAALLDVLDQLLELDVYGIREAIAASDRI